MTSNMATREYLESTPLSAEQVAAKVAAGIPDGSYVNLGIGQPTLVAQFLKPDSSVILHTENGMLGMGALADPVDEDADLVNAGKQFVTETPGCAYFHHADSFGMIRGGHIDYCVLGAFQVSSEGDLANWSTGAPDAIPAVGGAMDLALGARNIYVMMPLMTKEGVAKLVRACTYPLTAPRCVSRVYSDKAIFHLGNGEVVVSETYGVTVDDLKALLDMDLRTIEP